MKDNVKTSKTIISFIYHLQRDLEYCSNRDIKIVYLVFKMGSKYDNGAWTVDPSDVYGIKCFHIVKNWRIK